MADTRIAEETEVSAPALDDVTALVDVSDTTDHSTGTSHKITLQRLLGFLVGMCQGRLTTESGVAVSTSDRTAQGTIYFTPYAGNKVALYDGTRWRLYAFSEVSLALSSLTSGKNYDVFLYENAGTLTLELSAAWTNDTTRADALTTQDGVLVKSGATTRRYLGTIRTTGTTTTEDSGGGSTTQVGGKRFVWNYYNRVPRQMGVVDTTDSWSYADSTIRQADGATGNKVEYVVGDAAAMVRVEAKHFGLFLNNGSITTGVGVDSTTAFSGIRNKAFNGTGASLSFGISGAYVGQPGLGYHYLAWLERGETGATVTLYGDEGAAGGQSGLVAWVDG